MKSMKYLVVVSAIMLALVGCDKKERPTSPSDQTANPTNVEVANVVVEERPTPSCDDDALKSRLASLVGDNVQKSALESLQGASNFAELEQAFKSKTSSLTIDIADAKQTAEDCVAKVHVAFSESDIASANKAFAKTGLPTLAEQASEMGLELMDGHLVGDLVYQINGEALSIKATDNPAIDLASSTLAQAVVTQVAEQKLATPKKEPLQPKVTPIAPSANTRSTTTNANNNNTQNNANTQATVSPRPAERVEQPARPAVEPRPTPKPEPKPEPKPKVEPKPEPSVNHAPVTDNSSEITIVESNETY